VSFIAPVSYPLRTLALRKNPAPKSVQYVRWLINTWLKHEALSAKQYPPDPDSN